eukprot:m.275510 g.275510  ORF g.275510 m.275510 type:complete len:706 (-) comp19354_c0_seq5:118-2235(-)
MARPGVSGPLFRSVLVLSRHALARAAASVNTPGALPSWHKWRHVPDWIVFDFEDGAPAEDKPKVRENMRVCLDAALHRWNSAVLAVPQRPSIAVRVNTIHDDWLAQDLQAALHPAIDALLLPKVSDAAEMREWEQRVADAEDSARWSGARRTIRQRPLSLMPIIESASGLWNAHDIAHASTRNICLFNGAADLATDFGVSPNSSLLSGSRATIACAAKSAHLDAVDCAHLNVDDGGGYLREARMARKMGFTGKAVLYPNQVRLANQAFRPTWQETQMAQQVLGDGSHGLHSLQPTGSQLGRVFYGPPHGAHAVAVMSQANRMRSSSSVSKQPSVRPIAQPRGIDFHATRPGAVIRAEHEVTVSQGDVALWQANFMPCSVTEASGLAAQKLGLKGQLVPQTMLATLAVALAVSRLSEHAKLHLGLYNGIQMRPVYAGDTLSAEFEVKGWRLTSKKEDVILETMHTLRNQNDEAVYTVTKRTLFGASTDVQELVSHTDQADFSKPPSPSPSAGVARTLAQRCDTDICSRYRQPSPPLSKGALVQHRIVHPFNVSDVMQLCGLMRVTNAHHLDSMRFDEEELVVPGPLVLSAALANVGSDLGATLHTQLVNATNINQVNPKDLVASLSFVHDIQPVAGSANVEEVTVQTFGVKNQDIDELAQCSFPLGLFSSSPRLPREYEEFCDVVSAPLANNLVVQACQKVLRLKP